MKPTGYKIHHLVSCRRSYYAHSVSIFYQHATYNSHNNAVQLSLKKKPFTSFWFFTVTWILQESLLSVQWTSKMYSQTLQYFKTWIYNCIGIIETTESSLRGWGREEWHGDLWTERLFPPCISTNLDKYFFFDFLFLNLLVYLFFERLFPWNPCLCFIAMQMVLFQSVH